MKRLTQILDETDASVITAIDTRFATLQPTTQRMLWDFYNHFMGLGCLASDTESVRRQYRSMVIHRKSEGDNEAFPTEPIFKPALDKLQEPERAYLNDLATYIGAMNAHIKQHNGMSLPLAKRSHDVLIHYLYGRKPH